MRAPIASWNLSPIPSRAKTPFAEAHEKVVGRPSKTPQVADPLALVLGQVDRAGGLTLFCTGVLGLQTDCIEDVLGRVGDERDGRLPSVVVYRTDELAPVVSRLVRGVETLKFYFCRHGPPRWVAGDVLIALHWGEGDQIINNC